MSKFRRLFENQKKGGKGRKIHGETETRGSRKDAPGLE
jgi:hypothetical protein